MSYRVEDFQDMTINPFVVSRDNYVFDHYPDLQRAKVFSIIPKNKDDGKPYKEFRKKDLDILLKFVIIFIDPESPLADIRDYEKRRKYAIDVMKSRGLVENGRPYEEIMEEGLLFDALIFQYFQLINNHDYELWYSLNMQLRTFYTHLRKDLSEDKNGSVLADMDKRRMLLKDIENFKSTLMNLESQLFASPRLKKIIARKQMDEAIGGYAEMFAKTGPWTISKNQLNG